MKFYKNLWLLCFLCTKLHVSSGQNDSLVVSVLTCSPGKELYALYGHNAIRVVNKTKQTDIVYNYGTFDFDTPGFALKFMRGKLPYILSTSSMERFLHEYHYFERSVTEQVLHLTPNQKWRIQNYLDSNMKPENRAYKYDFFLDNCATRIRDVLEQNLENLTWNSEAKSDKTFRQIIKEYQGKYSWTNFGIDLIIGAPADKKTTLREEAFIPDYLSLAISKAALANTTNQPLEKSTSFLLQFNQIVYEGNIWFSPLFLSLLLLIFELFLFYKSSSLGKQKWIYRYDLFWLILLVVSSLLMAIMWFATDHIPTKENWNLIWANPMILIWWLNLKSKKTWFYVLSLFLLCCLGMSMIHANLVIPVLPQYFHPAIGIISLILVIKGRRIYASKH